MKEMANRIIDHYERHARDWDADRNRYIDPWNDNPWHDRFIAALPAGATVLDLGCGSGSPVAKHMAEHGLHVSGVDSSPMGMTGSAYPLAARLYVGPASNDPKADAYLAANCLLLWRRRMTNVLLSPYMAHGPAGISRNSTNFQSHASLTPRPR